MKNLAGESMNITEENLKAMQQLFPEAFEEGKIDFDVLRQLLGDFVDDEQERYSFKWNGKGKALRLSQTPSMGTLRPCKEESKDWDNTENLYIEGDNLEVLKLLQKSYYGKVKMIYIDPPYNTGGDFVYKDNFHDNIRNYKEVTGQIDGKGNKIDTNTESNGRFHTDWLNMMYPRLRLARNLLTDDGVIFISIDDNEQGNLKRLCDEVFGENNFLAILTRRCMHTVRNSSKDFNKNADYVLTYARDKVVITSDKNARIREQVDKSSNYKLNDNDGRGFYKLDPIYARNYAKPYTFTFKNGMVWSAPEGSYPRYSIESLMHMEETNQLNFEGKQPRAKRYLNEVQLGQPPDTIMKEEKVGFNSEGTKLLAEVLGNDKVFSQPKPSKLVEYLISILPNNDSGIILDFFSGSATTAHAIMKLNAEDGGNRKFIMVQLPEPIERGSDANKAGYQTICEIGKERIRRAGDKIKAEAGDKAADLDIGFKVFKLDSSNLQKWNPQPDDLVMTLQQAMDNFLPDRTEQDVLYEIILKMGLELTCQIEEEQAAGETVYIIGGGALMICLGRNITTAVAEAVVKLHEEYESELWQVVFRDTGFASDMDKTNVKETLKAAGLAEDSFVCV